MVQLGEKAKHFVNKFDINYALVASKSLHRRGALRKN